MKIEYKSDPLLLPYLRSSKENLQSYYDTHYASKHPAPSCNAESTTPTPSATLVAPPRSPQKNFTLRFHRKAKADINELEEYFKLPPEDFETCDPIHWWMGRRAQFPNLFWLARDILCIPGVSILSSCQWVVISDKPQTSGSAVVVERIFSGGRDTISLRRASLQPETIKSLMLSKKKLHLARAQGAAGQ
jgi:hypothetical protein